VTADSVLRARVVVARMSGELSSEQIAQRLSLPTSRVREWLRRPLTYPLRPCAGCAQLFAPVTPMQRFCCPAHRDDDADRSRSPERECELCGESFVPVHGTQRFCCPAHRVEHARGGQRAERECELCGASFVPIRWTQRFCCPAHRVEHAQRRARAERECELCGESFAPTSAGQRFCCPAHRAESARHVAPDETVGAWREHVAELEAKITRVREQLERRAA
jgi:hypothetical protein